MKTRRVPTVTTDIHQERNIQIGLYCRVSRCNNQLKADVNDTREIDGVIKNNGWMRSPDSIGFFCNQHTTTKEK
jgi:hypothetical protein